MRSLTLVMIAAAAAVLAACGSSSSTTATAPSTVTRCGVTIGSTALSVPAAGGTGTLGVTTARECSWTANSTVSWLTVRGSASGQGDGSVDYVVAPNSDPGSRQGRLEINDQQAQVTQSGGDCDMSLQESSASFSPSGGSGTIVVRASSAQCTWTAASDSSWITIRSGTSGTGNGTVAFDVAATSASPRTGTVLVAGIRFAVTQSQGCTFSVSPTSYSVGSAGGTTNITVTTGDGCPWTASSSVPWAAIAQGSSGSSSGVVQVVVSGVSGPQRTGNVVVAGQLVSITQSAGCAVTADASTTSFGASGGSGTVNVQGASGCDWTASADVPWITFGGATSGSGGASVGFIVAPTSGPTRTGNINLAGTQIAITQSGGCSVGVSPQSPQVGASGGNITITVTAGAGCAWTTLSGVPWITIASGASGSGDGTVTLTVAGSTAGSRTGNVVIGGQTIAVNQGSGCTFSIAPRNATAPSGSSTGSVTVTAGAGCSWTTGSNASWLTITGGSGGTSNGTVQYSVAANTGPARSGTLTIAGQTFTLDQAAGCLYSIAPNSASTGPGGGKGSVTVTATAGCTWSATSSASWLSVTAGSSGTGNGTVQYDASASGGPTRTATLTIAGQTFTLTQASGCTFDVSPLNSSVKGSGDTVNVTIKASDPACAWAVGSTYDWIVPSFVGTRNGSGSIELRIAPNPGAQRQGSATVAGQDVRVVQPPSNQ